MPPPKRRHVHREPNISCVVGPTCVDGRADILKSLPVAIMSSMLFLRYVDNRRLLAPSAVFQDPLIQAFCAPSFYKGIQLESDTGHQWLGFTIDAPARTAQFNTPAQPWQVRSPGSAGSWRLAASGFFSRAALIRQYAWPKESVLPQIRQLREIYVSACRLMVQDYRFKIFCGMLLSISCFQYSGLPSRL